MALTIKVHPSKIGIKPMDGYTVHSGGLVVGRFTLQNLSGLDKSWSWSINLFLTSGYDGITGGQHADLEVAKKQFREAWLAFLPYIGLQEIEDTIPVHSEDHIPKDPS